MRFKHSIERIGFPKLPRLARWTVRRPCLLDSPNLPCGIVRPWMSVDARLSKTLATNSSPLETVCPRRPNRDACFSDNRPMAVLPACRV